MRLAKKYKEQIADEWYEDDGFNEDGTEAYWLYLKPGYYVDEPGHHCIHEYNRAGAYKVLRAVVNDKQLCDCPRCQPEKSAGYRRRQATEAVGE